MEGYFPYDTPAPLPPEQNPDYHRKERRNLGRIGWALTLYLLVVTLLSGAIYYGANAFFPALAEHRFFDLLMQAVPSYLIGFPLFAGLLLGMPKKKPEKKKLGFASWIAFLAIAFFLMMAGNYIAGGLMELIQNIKGSEITNLIDQQITESGPLDNFILIVVLAPIVEELMCRKLIIDRLLPYSEALAVTVSGVFFGLLHGNFYQFFYATLLGVLFSCVYVKTGNIWHPILMHMIINFSGAMISDFLGDMTSDLASAPTSINPWEVVASVYSAAMMLLAICGAIFLIQRLRKLKLKPTGEHFLTLKTQFRLIATCGGTIVYLVICLLTFFSSLLI